MMRFLAGLVLVIILAGGIAASYVIYRLLETETVAIEASAQWQDMADGSRCMTAAFKVDARTLGVWYLSSPEEASVSGTVSVAGSGDEDVGLRIYSPANRNVYRSLQRMHEGSFQYEASVRGDYRFEIDNRHSSFASKDVTLSLCES
jgi:hypothetical protein